MVENNRNDYDDNGHGISFPLLETLISVQCILINHQNKSFVQMRTIEFRENRFLLKVTELWSWV